MDHHWSESKHLPTEIERDLWAWASPPSWALCLLSSSAKSYPQAPQIIANFSLAISCFKKKKNSWETSISVLIQGRTLKFIVFCLLFLFYHKLWAKMSYLYSPGWLQERRFLAHKFYNDLMKTPWWLLTFVISSSRSVPISQQSVLNLLQALETQSPSPDAEEEPSPITPLAFQPWRHQINACKAANISDKFTTQGNKTNFATLKHDVNYPIFTCRLATSIKKWFNLQASEVGRIFWSPKSWICITSFPSIKSAPLNTAYNSKETKNKWLNCINVIEKLALVQLYGLFIRIGSKLGRHGRIFHQQNLQRPSTKNRNKAFAIGRLLNRTANTDLMTSRAWQIYRRKLIRSLGISRSKENYCNQELAISPAFKKGLPSSSPFLKCIRKKLLYWLCNNLLPFLWWLTVKQTCS